MDAPNRSLISKLQGYADRHGKFALWRLPFFPFVLLITNPIRLAKTLWSAKVLAEGRWSEYNSFRAHNGINTLFYWTLAINFDRYGRNGRSPYVGKGDYHLGQWWHASLTSIYLYWRLGAMLPLLSMLGWLVLHLLWLQQPDVSDWWLTIVLILAAFSSYFYAATFVYLNYNAFGWLFMPLGLYGLFTSNYTLAAVGWLAASLGSLTVVFIAGIISVVWAVLVLQWGPLLAMLPAGLKLATHLCYVEDIRDALRKTAKAIGFVTDPMVKYQRGEDRKKLSVPGMYALITYLAFAAFAFRANPLFGLMGLTIVFLFLVNKKIARFADDQSIYMAMLSIATAIVVQVQDPWFLMAYWLAVSPLPFMIGAAESDEPYDRAKAYSPFCVGDLIKRCETFFKCIPEGSRVLLALNNPSGQYSRIFDGYRVIYELAFYVGNIRNVLVFPDWWAVFANNKKDSPDFWGRSPEEVNQRMIQWKADLVLVYQASGSELESAWENSGFVPLGKLDWGELVGQELRGERSWSRQQSDPVWWLLRGSPVGELKD